MFASAKVQHSGELTKCFGVFFCFLLKLVAILLSREAQNAFTTLLHEPFGGAGGSADSYGLCIGKPGGENRGGVIDHITAGIDLAAGIEEDAAVAGFKSADEDDDIVALSKGADTG